MHMEATNERFLKNNCQCVPGDAQSQASTPNSLVPEFVWETQAVENLFYNHISVYVCIFVILVLCFVLVGLAAKLYIS